MDARKAAALDRAARQTVDTLWLRKEQDRINRERRAAGLCPACGQPLLPGEVHCPACPFVLPYVPRGEYGSTASANYDPARYLEAYRRITGQADE
jgi:hypothetical protein